MTPMDRRNALMAQVPVWPGATLPQLFDKVAAAFPERPAILGPDRCWSYHEVRVASSALAGGLVARGVPAGSRVALIMANHAEFVIAKLAIARAGCIAVPVNFQLRRDEMRYVLGQSGCSAVIAMAEHRGRDYLEDLAALRSALENLRHVVIREEDHALPADFLTIAQLARLAGAAEDAAVLQRESVPGADDCSDIIYTSGTTGQPKGAILSHDMLLRAAYSSALTRAFEDGRRIQFALPMYHVFAYVECWIASLYVAGAIIPHAVFDAEAMLDRAERFAATDMVCVPVMTNALIAAARRRGRAPTALNAFFNSGGATVPGVWDDIRNVLGAREIHTAYGMTETTASTVCTFAEDPVERLATTNGRYKLAGAAGDPRIGSLIARYRVVDPQSGEEQPMGCDGELQVRGPVVTRGYYGKPDETRDAFTADGWFRSGDIGRLLEGGFLKLSGRLSETYRCGGEMVMPREIEEVLADYPGLAQALVVGVPDARMGETGCLCIVPQPGAEPDAGAILAFCETRLARFKVPRHTVVLRAEDVPLTVTGRPQKFLLAKLAAERLA